jgi:hypothetical protein
VRPSRPAENEIVIAPLPGAAGLALRNLPWCGTLTSGIFSLVSFSSDEPHANGEHNEADEYPDPYQDVDCINVFCTVRVHINPG